MKIKIVDANFYPTRDDIAPRLEMEDDNGNEYILFLSPEGDYAFQVSYGGDNGCIRSMSDFIEIGIIIRVLRAHKFQKSGGQYNDNEIINICEPIVRQMAFIALQRANIRLPLETTWGFSMSEMIDELIQKSIEFIYKNTD